MATAVAGGLHGIHAAIVPLQLDVFDGGCNSQFSPPSFGGAAWVLLCYLAFDLGCFSSSEARKRIKEHNIKI
jgi:hypothetical protein